ncbi:MAG: Eco57I restriction-modification methylase domain-containing protein [Chloroflexi bacterium]|nr:Eco57I restriction-modification methylase domain-containing protein [Chloroflexota bacterium]
MPINKPLAKRYLKAFDFCALFIEELGWDKSTTRLALRVEVDGHAERYELVAVAQKRGFGVFTCTPTDSRAIPNYAMRRKIDSLVVKSAHEHLIIFTDAAQTTQVWQWVKREAGKPAACSEHHFSKAQDGEPLIQKLEALAFSLAQEEDLSIVQVAGAVRAGLDLERVTKKFYERFKTEHAAFLKFVKGISDEADERWYASVMLDRLMFIYFIQRKTFLDGDVHYLRNRLATSKKSGADRFYSHFLTTLFFEGFAKKASERSAATNTLLGKVPYLNGGLFTKHPLEERYGKDIDIADAAFAKVFAFFDEYQWHLDERPLRDDKEINPDVLGYIFEKYINQKQMGAFYTKEDITGYIGEETIIPHLFDAAGIGAARIAPILQANPNRYIYDAIKHGVDQSLPKEIAAGIKDVAKRTEWNRSAPAEVALPTETWREVVARRNRYAELKSKIENREIQNVNDLITFNLDIRQLAQDVIEHIEDPDQLRALWHALEILAVLDPTVGSGAFLFAALNILEALYEACLDRMQVFLDELERSGEKSRPEKFGDFKEVLARVAEHPNRRYFILKSIIVNNLYGVDIMGEAVEICKLRLFLKLVAQIERAEDIEPLPDIDFNIRAGNSLVGFATYDEVRKAVLGDTQGRMDLDDDMTRIDERAELVDRAFKMFREQQTRLGGTVTPADKQNLRDRLSTLEAELNRYLAKQYGVDPNKKATVEKWRAAHQPFHWFIEFYGILKRGGFDVIIGNPPYVEYGKVKGDYTVRGYKTEDCGNLYANVIERSLNLLQSKGCLSMIVPVSLVATPGYHSIRELVLESGTCFVSSFNIHPSCLFEGANPRLCIPIVLRGRQNELFTTYYQKWYAQERSLLFQRLTYTRIPRQITSAVVKRAIPKIGSQTGLDVFTKLVDVKKTLTEFVTVKSRTSGTIYYRRTFGAFVLFYDCPPKMFDEHERPMLPTELKEIYFSAQYADLMLAIYFSNAYYLYTYLMSDCRNMNRPEVETFPINLGILDAKVTEQL